MKVLSTNGILQIQLAFLLKSALLYKNQKIELRSAVFFIHKTKVKSKKQQKKRGERKKKTNITRVLANDVLFIAQLKGLR